MAHLLRYGASDLTSLIRGNTQHNYAHKHAFHIYDTNSVYSMVPKNGCTSLRVSIALQNGAIADESQWAWIHNNNDTFRPSLRELALARYRFTILRCPYSRLVSCFLDKILKRTQDAWQFHAATGMAVGLERLTFRRFCTELMKPQIRTVNLHWRPQIDFLVYDDYDDVFCFESFDEIIPALKKRAGLTVVDARPLARHDSSHYKVLPLAKPFADTELWQVEQLQMSGMRPDPRSFFDDELKAMIAAAYADDFRLYLEHFPGQSLFEPPARPSLATVTG
ncbi:MAG: sulfotransferase family 2 domain-containing protein [Alphaproteobacteria bacterium]|nr:sulfotransferase family 2 domain-containing protein [Alphaproteobacteria bacterium]